MVLEAGLFGVFCAKRAGETKYAQLEQTARAQGIGIWSVGNPVAPWDFRHGGNKAPATQQKQYSWPQQTQQTQPTGTNQYTPVPVPVPAPVSAAGPSRAQAAPVNTQPSAGGGDGMVYITATGQKHHTSSCRTMKQGVTPISIVDAKARGYTPCKVCNP